VADNGALVLRRRYEISHPVVNDSGMALWRALGVSSWPTLALVSPGGRLIAMLAGEGHRQDLDDFIAAALDYYGEQGLLDDTPVPQVSGSLASGVGRPFARVRAVFSGALARGSKARAPSRGGAR
jgi:hypothetical protein